MSRKLDHKRVSLHKRMQRETMERERPYAKRQVAAEDAPLEDVIVRAYTAHDRKVQKIRRLMNKAKR